MHLIRHKRKCHERVSLFISLVSETRKHVSFHDHFTRLLFRYIMTGLEIVCVGITWPFRKLHARICPIFESKISKRLRAYLLFSLLCEYILNTCIYIRDVMIDVMMIDVTILLFDRRYFDIFLSLIFNPFNNRNWIFYFVLYFVDRLRIDIDYVHNSNNFNQITYWNISGISFSIQTHIAENFDRYRHICKCNVSTISHNWISVIYIYGSRVQFLRKSKNCEHL